MTISQGPISWWATWSVWYTDAASFPAVWSAWVIYLDEATW
jgi:hypothetical protein